MAEMKRVVRSKLFQSMAEQPYVSLAAILLFIMGIALGISARTPTEAAGLVALAAKGAKESYDVQSGLLRAALTSFLLFASVSAAAYVKPLFALSCLALAAKGFFAGAALWQLLYEYGVAGALYALPLIVFPLLFSATALFLAFLWAGKAVLQNKTEAVQTKLKKSKARFHELVRNLILLCMGIVAEGVVAPYFFMLLADLMTGV